MVADDRAIGQCEDFEADSPRSPPRTQWFLAVFLDVLLVSRDRRRRRQPRSARRRRPPRRYSGSRRRRTPRIDPKMTQTARPADCQDLCVPCPAAPASADRRPGVERRRIEASQGERLRRVRKHMDRHTGCCPPRGRCLRPRAGEQDARIFITTSPRPCRHETSTVTIRRISVYCHTATKVTHDGAVSRRPVAPTSRCRSAPPRR